MSWPLRPNNNQTYDFVCFSSGQEWIWHPQTLKLQAYEQCFWSFCIGEYNLALFLVLMAIYCNSLETGSYLWYLRLSLHLLFECFRFRRRLQLLGSFSVSALLSFRFPSWRRRQITVWETLSDKNIFIFIYNGGNCHFYITLWNVSFQAISPCIRSAE